MFFKIRNELPMFLICSRFSFNWSQFKFFNLILNCIKKKTAAFLLYNCVYTIQTVKGGPLYRQCGATAFFRAEENLKVISS